MVSMLKRAALYGGAIIAALAIGVFAWLLWPISVNENQADPAVLVANEIASGNIFYEEGYVGPDGARTHYVTAGRGDPIIFVHGFPSYWFSMFGLMEAFKDDHQVIAIDGLGVGRSDAPAKVDAYKLERLVGSIEQVVEHFDLDRVHLVGHDWGVALVTAYAQAHPDRVNTVTTMGALPHNVLLARLEYDEEHRETFAYTSYFASANPVLLKVMGAKQQVWDSTYAPLLEKEYLPQAQAARMQKDMGNPKRLDRLINWYRANLVDFSEISAADYWPAKSARLTAPAIFIYGDEDVVVTDPLVADFAALSDDLKIVELAGVAHRPHFEARERVIAEIEDLITRAGAPE